jgi:hypothetical protein
MAFTFPSSPVTNDTYSVGSRTYTWTGTKWVLSGGVITATQLEANSVTTVKILDANVTQAKLGTTLSAVTVTTAANRDTAVASPFTGQLVFLTDTKKIQVWDGTSWLNITLAPPETPTSLSATALSTTSVSVAFTAGGANGSPITNYKYALSTDSGVTYGSFVALDPVDITSPITISGLTAGTTYYIKLKAVNDMGDSVASAAVSIATLATPEAPTSLSAGSITTTSVAISFTPGSDNGFAITNYQYALSTNGGSSYGSFTALDPADATSSITISGLTADTAYYIKLKAVNSGGAGTESSAVSFTTIATVTVDYLVVAGGGGAEADGGGGGAGGLRSTVTATGGGGTLETTLTLLTGTGYTVTVGNGGAGPTSTNGSDSIFSTITSTGGGRGRNTLTGILGGSGAGGSYSGGGNGSALVNAGGAGTTNQGFAGGSGNNSNSTAFSSGGGGGANAVGSNAGTSTSSQLGGAGGAGVAVSITGSSVTYAGGGGGGGGGGSGAGGAGGGGSNSAGTANRGGGGSNSGNGGSGVVILRYADTRTITFGAGLTGTESSALGGYKRATITAGSGNVSWT